MPLDVVRNLCNDEIQWLQIAWIGHFVSILQNPERIDIADLLLKDGYLELGSQSYQTAGTFSIHQSLLG